MAQLRARVAQLEGAAAGAAGGVKAAPWPAAGAAPVSGAADAVEV